MFRVVMRLQLTPSIVAVWEFDAVSARWCCN